MVRGTVAAGLDGGARVAHTAGMAVEGSNARAKRIADEYAEHFGAGPRLQRVNRRWGWWAWLPCGFLAFWGGMAVNGWLGMLPVVVYLGPLTLAFIDDELANSRKSRRAACEAEFNRGYSAGMRDAFSEIKNDNN